MDKNTLACLAVFTIFNLYLIPQIVGLVSAATEKDLGKRYLKFQHNFLGHILLGLLVTVLIPFVTYLEFYGTDPDATNFFRANINWNLVCQLAAYWLTFQLLFCAIVGFCFSSLDLLSKIKDFLIWQIKNDLRFDFVFTIVLGFVSLVLWYLFVFFFDTYPKSF